MGRRHSSSHHHRRKQDTTAFNALLNGAQEVPPVTTTALGTGSFVYNKKCNKLYYAIAFSGLSTPFSAAHFHLGAPGATGPVIEPIVGWTLAPGSLSGTVTGVWKNLSHANRKALKQGNVYVNIHSTLHPTGEIRGQVKQ